MSKTESVFSSRPSDGFFLPVRLNISINIFLLFIVLTLMFGAKANAETDPIEEAGRTAVLDSILQNAVRKQLISGAVVLIGNRTKTVYVQAIGKAGFNKSSKPLEVNTVFDIASLTKVFATTPAIIKLMDQGQLSLLDPISKWFPEFEGKEITVLNLLTHTSGLYDTQLNPEAPLESAIRRTSKNTGSINSGNRFFYADSNFILLGNLVRRITSMGLDQYCSESFYAPLKMKNTAFKPDSSHSIAATLGGKNGVNTGEVQDPNARLLGGVAGHAGLFSTAEDLGIFIRMLLNNGKLNNRIFLSSSAVSQMTAPYYFRNGRIVRGLGWDRESPYSSPKGTLFSEYSFGHTGYSGASVWIDPDTDLFVVLLTTRLDYKNRRSFNKLRSDISTVAASLFKPNKQP